MLRRNNTINRNVHECFHSRETPSVDRKSHMILWRHELPLSQQPVWTGIQRQISMTSRKLDKHVKFNEKRTYPETMKPQPRLTCYLYHNFFFSLSILLSNLSFIFPCINHLVQCQHSHALFDAHVHLTANVT